MKKRFFAAFAACAMVLSLAGCGKQNPEDILNNWDSAFNNVGGTTSTSSTKSSSAVSSKPVESVSQPEVTKIDPFEGVAVTFLGMAPNGTVEVSGGNNNVTYNAEPAKGLKNGDVVTVTAALRPGVTTLALGQETKEFTVEGLAGYAMSLSDISDDIMGKMQSQAEDLLTVEFVGNSNGSVLKDKQLLGCYFLSPKEGFSTSTYNTIYLVCQ